MKCYVPALADLKVTKLEHLRLWWLVGPGVLKLYSTIIVALVVDSCPVMKLAIFGSFWFIMIIFRRLRNLHLNSVHVIQKGLSGVAHVVISLVEIDHWVGNWDDFFDYFGVFMRLCDVRI